MNRHAENIKYFIVLRIGLLLISMIASVSICRAQIAERHLIAAKNYINCNLAYLVLEEYVKKYPKYQQDFDSIKPYLNVQEVEQAKSISDLEKLMEGKFALLFKRLSIPINSINISEYSSLSINEAASKLVNDAFNLLPTQYKYQYPALSNVTREPLISSVTDYLQQNKVSEAEKPQTLPVSNANEKSIRKIPVPIIDQSDGFFSLKYVSFWYLLPLLVSIGVMLFIFILVRKELQQANSYIKQLHWSREDRYMSLDNEKNSDLFKSISEIKNALNELRQHNKQSQAVLDALPQQSTQKGEVFYMSGPADNYFPTTARSPKNENTVYKFMVNATNTQEASFEPHTAGASINEIVNRRYTYIKPACLEENEPDREVKNIITLRRGQAILEGNKWIIKTKARIRYE